MTSRDVRHLVGEDPAQDLRGQAQRLGTNQQAHAIAAVPDQRQPVGVCAHLQRRSCDARSRRETAELIVQTEVSDRDWSPPLARSEARGPGEAQARSSHQDA